MSNESQPLLFQRWHSSELTFSSARASSAVQVKRESCDGSRIGGETQVLTPLSQFCMYLLCFQLSIWGRSVFLFFSVCQWNSIAPSEGICPAEAFVLCMTLFALNFLISKYSVSVFLSLKRAFAGSGGLHRWAAMPFCNTQCLIFSMRQRILLPFM